MRVNRQQIFKIIAFLGPALLVVGYIRYSVRETLGTLELIMLIAGGVLSLAALVFNFRAIRDSSRKRSSRLGANTTVMTVAVLALIGFGNFLGYRHHKRIDLTTEKLYSLSDQTRKVVSDLKRDVKVILFDKQDVRGLGEQMKEYRNLSSRFSFERIDPQRNLEIARSHKVTMGDVVVTAGDRTEKPKDTTEQAIINAIIKVTRDSLKKVYFVDGHGEKKLSSTNEADGYGVVDKMLKDENYETKSVNLVSSNEVPSDCDVLVLAGPKQSLFQPEASAIAKYLEKGGKAMLLIDPDTDPKLDDVQHAWGIQLGDNTVVDVSGVGRFFQMGPGAPVARTYGSHPITEDFEGTMTFFPMSRSVETTSAGGATAIDLLKTSEESWAETELGGGAEIRLDEGKDKRGPITLGVAVTRSEGDKEGRLVVIGDSDFASNQFVSVQRNGDLFMNSINWLAQDEDLISIRPKNPADRRVSMTEADQNQMFWLTLVLMPLATIGSGVYIWWRRR
jgi:ABC-type uncharacterized transport system involved in gliding motility auxiliary subunit